MTVETLKDVLDWTQKFHGNLSDCLHKCAKSNESERSRLLLEYLAGHEEKLSALVSEFVASADDKALNTLRYNYMDKLPLPDISHCDVPFHSLNADDIMDAITQKHEQVIELHRHFHGRAETESIRELMENLQSLEEHEMMLITQAANRFQDM